MAQQTEVRWLDPDDPADTFPDPDDALTDPNGLLAIGGDLSSDRLIAAYRRGIFPWFDAEQPILWWSPNPRAVLLPGEFHVSRSLRKSLGRGELSASVDQAFAQVIARCAERGDDQGTWITPDMMTAYRDLHRRNVAHSIEIWNADKLIGGVYGINLGRVFFGESMFSRETDASKIALLYLVSLCRELGIDLIDCQVASNHLASLGSRAIPRTEFNALLRRLQTFSAPSDWARTRHRITRDLARGPH